MGNNVIVYYDGSNTIKEMSNTELEYVSDLLLADFNSSNTGTGTVSVNPGSTTGLTLIGTFTDTARPGSNTPGTHPVGTTINSIATFNFYQDLQSVTENITVRPMMNTTGNDLQRMPDSNVNSDFILRTQQRLVNSGTFGIGSYKLQPSAPTDGTWVEKATLTNTLSNASNTTKLWRKSATGSTPTTIRPLKFDGTDLQRMTDAEIKQYTPRLRNQIRQGVGQYKVQTNAPTSGGTWVIAGAQFDDTVYQVANQNFTSNFSNTFSGTFTNTFAGFFSSTYNRFQPFSGAFQGSFSGSRTKFFTGSFTGFFTGFFTGSFTGLTVQSSTQSQSNVKLWARIA